MRISDWSSDVCSSDLGFPASCALIHALAEIPEAPPDAPLPYPFLRRAAHLPCRPAGPPVRLDPPQARPRPATVRRPARHPWAHAVRDRRQQPAVRAARGRPGGKRHHADRSGRETHGGDGQPGDGDRRGRAAGGGGHGAVARRGAAAAGERRGGRRRGDPPALPLPRPQAREDAGAHPPARPGHPGDRSEEHTSELQSLMRISYAVFCLKKKKKKEKENSKRINTKKQTEPKQERSQKTMTT